MHDDPKHNPVDYNFASAQGLHDENLLPGLNEMRDFAPVVWSDYQRGWMILGYQECWDAAHDTRLSNVRLQIDMLRAIPEEERATSIPNICTYVPNWIINIDSPQHIRIRKLMMKAFTRKMMRSMKPFVENVIDELIDEIKARRGEIEWVKQVAFEMPARTIMKILGIPDRHRDMIRNDTPAIIQAFQTPMPTREGLIAADQAMAKMNAVCLEEIEKRRVAPQDDLLTALVGANEDNDRLNVEELLGACQVILTAGYDTTANSNVLGTIALERHPEQKAYFLSRPDEMEVLLHELFRYIAMSAHQIRIAKEDVEYGGKAIAAGDLVYLSFAAGNRDPREFDDPESLDFTRDATNSLTFAPGPHHCLGHYLARMQLAIFYQKFYAEFDRVEILDEDLRYTPTYAFRGLQRLNVRCHPK